MVRVPLSRRGCACVPLDEVIKEASQRIGLSVCLSDRLLENFTLPVTSGNTGHIWYAYSLDQSL